LGLGLNGKKKNWPFGPGNGHRPTTSPFPNFFFSSLSHPPLSLPSFSPCSFFPLPNISPPPLYRGEMIILYQQLFTNGFLPTMPY
jgi:hypothetical protein